jgi:ketosteroid isomerase-like protein
MRSVDVEAELVEVLERFCARFSARDVDGVDELFAPDERTVMITSEEALLRGPEEIRAFLERYARGPTTYSWQWHRRKAWVSGSVGWLLAEGAEIAVADGVEQRFPYRMTLVCERRGDRWLITQIHGSSPQHD